MNNPLKSTMSSQRYFLLFVGTIIIALLSRKFDQYIPPPIHKNAGDTLWATTAFWFFRMALPRKSTAAVLTATASTCVLIEFQKPLQLPLLETLRQLPGGRLIFGFVFSWGDLYCYFIGIGLAVALERLMRVREDIRS